MSIGGKPYYEDKLMMTIAPGSFVLKSDVNQPGTHYYDAFDLNLKSHFLPRRSYCQNLSSVDTVMTADGGVDVNDPSALSWSYVDSVVDPGTGITYDHNINRAIKDELGNPMALPGMNWYGGAPFIGALGPYAPDCNNLKFLIGE